MKLHYVYMIKCDNGSYYTGYSTNPKARYEKHCVGTGAKYTRAHKPKSMVVLYTFDSKSEALKKDYKVKQLTHKEKEALFKVAKVAENYKKMHNSL